MAKSAIILLKCMVLVVCLGLFSVFSDVGRADTLSLSCSSAPVTAPMGGGTVVANVDCLINAPNSNSSYTITSSSENFLAPGLVTLTKSLNTISATRQASVTSPDGTVNSISGTSQGFTASLSRTSSLQTIRFQYSVTTTSSTPSGRYVSEAGGASYQYRICTNKNCNQQIFTGTAPTALTVDVPGLPVSVSCASPSVNATPGGGPFSLTVVCTISGGNAAKLYPASENIISPGTISLSSGASALTATLQPTVTSPDSTFTGISGTAGGGFTGNITAIPAKIQVQYTGSTTNATPAGTYTSSPVTFAWSTL